MDLTDALTVPQAVTVALSPDGPLRVIEDEAIVAMTGTVTGPTSATYTWEIQDGVLQSGSLAGNVPYSGSVSADFRSITTRTVYLRATDGLGCNVADSLVIQTEQAKFIFIPSVFTPNGDGANEFFTLLTRGLRFEAQIFDRWGNLIHTFDNNVEAWNGKMRNTGAECPEGVYVYHIKVIDDTDGTENFRNGTVTLLR
jgi:gliding motility-associated-like protein